MIVNGINASVANNTYISASNESKKGETDLGIDDFFTLMAAQLENQSMYDTVDNTQFIAQMAQFASLSQISELNSTIKSDMAISLIGKSVSVVQIDAAGLEKAIIGKVEQVSYKDGVPYICVQGGFYQISDIIDISE